MREIENKESDGGSSVRAENAAAGQRSVVSRLGHHILPSLFASFLAAGRVLLASAILIVVLFFGALALLKWINPPTSAVMLAERLAGNPVEHQWVPIERISANLVRAVVASEDVRFCSHHGIDTREINAALRRAQREGFGSVRGASTITMQVAKNLFLWQDRNLLRKGLELVAAVGIDLMWSKRRIIEVYLNIAQWGEHVYGAEAAARHYFGKSARRLSTEQAALLAVSLPSPSTRSARRPSRMLRRLARRIQVRKEHVPGAHLCVYAARQ